MASGTRTPSEGDLVLHLLGREARRVLLDQETLHVAVVDVAGPDDRDIGERGVADPLLCAVEDPAVALLTGGGGEAADGAGADVGFGQAEGADLLHAGHGRQPLGLLLLGAAEIDRAHGQAAVHAHEGRHRRVDAGQFHGHEPVGQEAAAGAAVAVVGQAGDAELGHGRQHLEGELGPAPVDVDDRGDVLLHESPDPFEEQPVLLVEEGGEIVEVALHRRRDGRAALLAHSVANIGMQFLGVDPACADAVRSGRRVQEGSH